MSLVTLGHDTQSGEPVYLDDEDRLRGLYILGKTGTGKTTLIEQLVLQDLRAGLGGCLLDPHGDLTERVLAQIPPERADDIVILDPRDTAFPFGLNPYRCRRPGDPEEVGRTVAQVVDLFEKLWGASGSEGSSWGPRLAQFIRNTAFTLVANPGLTMAEIPALLTDATFRKQAVENVTNPQVQFFWRTYDALNFRQQLDESRSTLNKLDEFLTQPVVATIVGQTETTANFRRLMDEGRFVLVPLGLGRLGAPVVSLLGSLIVLEILNAALSRENAPVHRRRQFNLYADEFQRFATPAFAELLTEARKYGVATTIAHQVRSQLDEHTRDAALNAANLIVFAVHGEDGEEMAKQFSRTPPPPEATGAQPARTVSRQALSDLRAGHRDPRVRSLIGRFVAPLLRYADLRGNGLYHWVRDSAPDIWRFFSDNGIYYTSGAKFQKGLALMDSHFAALMEGQIRPTSEEHARSVLQVVVELRAYFGAGPCEYFADPRPRFIVEDYNQDGDPMPELGFDTRSQEALLDYIRGVMKPDATSAALSAKECMRFIEARESYWQDNIKYRLQPEPEVTKQLCLDRAAQEGLHCFSRVAEFIDLGMLLAKDPIWVNSGQWVPTLDRPRSYADVEDEVANDLVNQPPFHARARLVHQGQHIEHLLQTPSFVLLDEGHGFQGAAAIRDWCRMFYCRPREDIEAELAARTISAQDGLRTVRVQLADGSGEEVTRPGAVCAKCGAPFQSGARYCSSCGTKRPD